MVGNWYLVVGEEQKPNQSHQGNKQLAQLAVSHWQLAKAKIGKSSGRLAARRPPERVRLHVAGILYKLMPLTPLVHDAQTSRRK